MTTRVKSGGRRKGSLDKGERQLVTAEMAGDILTVYKRLGGVKWLLEFAKANPGEFLRQGLSRLMPAAAKDDEPGSTYNQYNFNQQDSFEAARRIAFTLSKALNADPSVVIEHDIPVAERAPVAPPQDAYHAPPAEHVQVHQPEPVEDPNKQRWAEELHLTPEERRERDLIRETREPLESYHGSSAEHGRGPIRSSGSFDRDPRAAQRDRILRRNQLL
jgi:hypothetical protein